MLFQKKCNMLRGKEYVGKFYKTLTQDFGKNLENK